MDASVKNPTFGKNMNALFVYLPKVAFTLKPENTHPWEKDHCTVGLRFNKTGLDLTSLKI